MKKLKKLKKLPEGWDKEGYRYVGALMEDVQSNIRSFGEYQSMMSETWNGKFNTIVQEVGIIKEDVTTLKGDVYELKSDVKELKSDVKELKSDVKELKSDVSELKQRQTAMEIDIKEIRREITSIKNEIAELKQILTGKADIERLHNIEERIKRLEEITR